MEFIRDLWWYFKQEKMLYGLSILGAALVGLMRPIVSSVVGVLVDKMVNKTITSGDLMVGVIYILILGILIYGMRNLWQLTLYVSAAKLSRLLRNRLYLHFTRQPPEFYHRHRIGDLMAHATNDIQAVEMTAAGGFMLLQGFFIVGGLIIVSMVVLVSWRLTLLTLIPMVLLTWINRYYGSLLNKFFRKAQEAFSDLNGKVQENISGIRVVKSFGLENAEIDSFKALSEEVLEKNMAASRVNALYEPTIQLLVGVCFFLALAFGSWFVVKGEMTIGQITQFTMMLNQLISPMLAFGFALNNLERGKVSYTRVNALLQTKVSIADKPSTVDEVPTGDLSFRIDAFNYPGTDTPSLEDIKITVSQGQTLGITGRTGSGKSTLLRLLLREFDIKQGDIKIAGRSISDYRLDCLRQAIGYVPQDHFLFSATVAENIAFGKPEADKTKIEAAAILASIHEDIIRFQHGYGTLVGERGVTLSGGQRQRISIARALVLEPEILILDDCLSAVDARTEQTILEELRKNRSNKTTLIAAHRLSAIEHADLIIVLEEGRLREQGTHDQLIAKNGWHAQIHRQQQLESLVQNGGVSS